MPRRKGDVMAPVKPVTRAMKLLRERPELVERLLLLAEPPSNGCIRSHVDARNIVSPMLAGQEREHLVGIALDRRHGVIDAAVLSIGSDVHAVVEPRYIFRWALTRKRLAVSIVIAHNHPSGNHEPSSEDVDVTNRVAEAGRVVGVTLLDHLIVAGDAYVSLAERGLLPMWGQAAVSFTVNS